MLREFADVSVIVPAYQTAGTIGRALKSVAAQELLPREAIVVDDGNDDATFEAASAMAGHMNGVELTVLRQQNMGAGAARNRALGAATGTFVAFLDADDEWLPEKLRQSLTHLDDPDMVLVAHDYIRHHADGRETVISCARHFRRAWNPYATLYRRGYIGTCTVVARRDAVMAVGGFDAGLPTAQDFALWLALLREPGTRFLVFPEALSRYHPTSGSITTHTERRLDCCLQVAHRFYPALGQHSLSPAAGLGFRILAVHAEALATHLGRGGLTAAIGTLARLPVNTLMTTARALAAPYRDGSVGAAPETIQVRGLGIALGMWIVAALGAYLAQFSGIAEPLLRLL
jgi:hypothetical protein